MKARDAFGVGFRQHIHLSNEPDTALVKMRGGTRGQIRPSRYTLPALGEGIEILEIIAKDIDHE